MASVTSASIDLPSAPIERHFGPLDYRADVSMLDMLEREDGELWFGTSGGIIRYDGTKWSDVFELPGRNAARSLVEGADGRVYIGGYDIIGQLELDATGRLKFNDLLPSFGNKTTRALEEVWQVVDIGTGVVFRTDSLLLFAAYDGRREIWSMDVDLRSIWFVQGVLYGRIHGVGLCRLNAGHYELVPGGERFSIETVSRVVELAGKTLIVADAGFFSVDESGIRPEPSPDTGVLREAGSYEALAWPDGRLVVGTFDGSVLVFGEDLRLEARTPSRGHSVLNLTRDREGGLWALTESGITRQQFGLPISIYTARHGLVGAPLDVTFHDGAFLVATSNGVYQASIRQGDATFVLAVQTELEANALLSTEAGLLIGDREGVLVVSKGAEAKRILTSDNVFALRSSRAQPGVVYVFSNDEIARIKPDSGEWNVLSRWPNDLLAASDVHEEAPGSILLDNLRGGIQRWRFDLVTGRVISRAEFGPEQGLQFDPEFGSTLVLVGGEVIAESHGALFRKVDDRFMVFEDAPFSLTKKPEDMGVFQASWGEIAYSSDGVWIRRNAEQAWNKAPLPDQVGRSIYWIREDPTGMLWSNSWDGLARLDVSVVQPLEFTPSVRLVAATLQRNSGEKEDLSIQPGLELLLDPTDGLSLEYRAASLNRGLELRTRLSHGNNEEPWSPWEAENGGILTYSDYPPGDYVFQVEGRTLDGLPVTPLSWRFVLLPRWWQTRVAQFSMAVLAFALLAVTVAVVTRVRTRRIQQAKLELERVVAERTQQLRESSELLTGANQALLDSHKELKESGRRSDLIFKAMNDALAGELIDNKYQVEEKIGSGGFGTVYRAKQIHLGVPVALKVLKPVAGENREQALDRFRSEGISGMRVNHPNAVQLMDFAVYLDALVYLAMEYVPGQSLESILKAQGKLPALRVLDILEPVCRALAAAHEAKVIHRDVKPGNIMLLDGPAGSQIKLVDFGIAKSLESQEVAQRKRLTATGFFVGTPIYMAPERLTDQHYDGRSDVYSIGVVAFQALSGRLPFEDDAGDTISLVMRIVNEPPVPLAAVAQDVPTSLQQLIMRLLSKDPTARPRAAELADLLSALKKSEAVARAQPNSGDADRMTREGPNWPSSSNPRPSEIG